MLTLVASACGSDGDAVVEDLMSTASGESRPMADVEVTVSLSGGKAPLKVVATPATVDATEGLHLTWSEHEQLGVYIQQADGSILRAGSVVSSGSEGDTGPRAFKGAVMEKADGEHYIYMHPDLGTATAIDFTAQRGALGSTDHLPAHLPLVWRENQSLPETQGYVMHLTLTMNEDPGQISAITLHTMKQGAEGTTPDRIFPKTFSTAGLALPVNRTLPAKASGLTLDAETYTDALTLQPAVGSAFTATKEGNVWKVEAYLAAASVGNLDVFRSKYNIRLEAEHGTFFVNEYLSFPGQQAQGVTSLAMLANGKCYNLLKSMSKNVSYTVISDQYKVNSLLGMWNQFGKPYDPFGLVCADADVPSHLKSHILDRKSNFTARTLISSSPQNSPTFTWDMVVKQSTASGIKQQDVTYNNLEIVGEPTEVFVTFISEYAWSQNLLGYYHYPTGEVPLHPSTVLKTFIFPNVSKGGHVPYNKGGSQNIPNVNPNSASQNVGTAAQAPLEEYTTVQLLYYGTDGTVSKTFPVGTTIGFMIMRDPQASNSGHDEGSIGDSGDMSHTGYQPRQDNSLVNWNAWRLFTNTAWNSNNSGWWNASCWNFFCSADVGDLGNGGIIPGLALYGAKDDASHNYNYSFSAMLYMVSTSNPASLQTQNKCYFNIGTGAQVINK